MEEGVRVTGSMIQAYMICARQTWLISRQVYPGQDNVYLEIGRLISEESYQRERKEVRIDNLLIDLVRKEGSKNMVVGEVKKTSRAEEAARLQLAFYLYELYQMGIEAEGELLYPEEKRKEKVLLDEEMYKKVAKIKESIFNLIMKSTPPEPQRIPRCGKCSYAELCWA